MGVMTTPSGRRPKHLASSPFKQAAEPVVEVFEVGDRVTHDIYGLGQVTHVDSAAVTAPAVAPAADAPTESDGQ